MRLDFVMRADATSAGLWRPPNPADVASAPTTKSHDYAVPGAAMGPIAPESASSEISDSL